VAAPTICGHDGKEKKSTDVLEEHTASIFRVEKYVDQAASSAAALLILQP
jgi:hypothetical protein